MENLLFDKPIIPIFHSSSIPGFFGIAYVL